MSITNGLKGGQKVTINTLNTAKRVKDARMNAKLTQTELGKMIGKIKQWCPSWNEEISNLALRWRSISLMLIIKQRNFFCHESP